MAAVFDNALTMNAAKVEVFIESSILEHYLDEYECQNKRWARSEFHALGVTKFRFFDGSRFREVVIRKKK